ncbi:MAG: tetratricopeptide repeat protein [Anaerolineales bacterium]|nr:tetratricopeptide repeat protein [Anaerolineales bacterium]
MKPFMKGRENRDAQKKSLIFILCLIPILVPACNSKPEDAGEDPVVVADQEPTGSQESAGELSNYLVQAEGSIQLRREGWKDFLPTGFGALVEPGDLLRVDDGGLASVFCGSDAAWDEGLVALAADGLEHGVPCQSGRPPRPWTDTAALRGVGNRDVPYIIAPRNTALREDQPALHWHKMEGNETYAVSLIGEDMLDRPPVDTDSVEIPWPDAWPPLEPGATYVLIVEAGNIKSNDGNEANVGLGFWLLPETEMERIQELELAIRAQNLSSQGTDLLLAEICQINHLYSEANRLFQSALRYQPSPALWLEYGRVQLETGLAAEAIEAFSQALDAAKTSGQLHVQAESLLGLGLGYRMLGDEARAVEYFKTAAEIFQQIGDQRGISHADELIRNQ